MNRVKEIEEILNEVKEESENIQHIVKRLLLGDEITLNYNKKKAYINYYIKHNTEEIKWVDGVLATSYSFISFDSGNIETKEDHYRSSLIVDNEDELTSTKTIIKYNL